MDPADVIAQVLHDVWQPVERIDQFPSRWSQAESILAALAEFGFCVVQRPEGLGQVLERLDARNRGRPSWSDGYDPLVDPIVDILSLLRTQ